MYVPCDVEKNTYHYACAIIHTAAASLLLLRGSKKAAGLEFPPGDTFGFRSKACPTFQVMADHTVVTCLTRGVAAMLSFEDCLKVRPGSA